MNIGTSSTLSMASMSGECSVSTKLGTSFQESPETVKRKEERDEIISFLTGKGENPTLKIPDVTIDLPKTGAVRLYNSYLHRIKAINPPYERDKIEWRANVHLRGNQKLTICPESFNFTFFMQKEPFKLTGIRILSYTTSEVPKIVMNVSSIETLPAKSKDSKYNSDGDLIIGTIDTRKIREEVQKALSMASMSGECSVTIKRKEERDGDLIIGTIDTRKIREEAQKEIIEGDPLEKLIADEEIQTAQEESGQLIKNFNANGSQRFVGTGKKLLVSDEIQDNSQDVTKKIEDKTFNEAYNAQVDPKAKDSPWLETLDKGCLELMKKKIETEPSFDDLAQNMFMNNLKNGLDNLKSSLKVLVNGNPVAEIKVAEDLNEDEAAKQAMEKKEVKKYAKGKELKKVVYKPECFISLLFVDKKKKR